jgi:predicted enzyme related to lactoylglutathione lyase
MIRIKLASVFVDDQEKALAFYTDILGFEKRNDVQAGEYRWLTVGTAGEADGIELVLEPNVHPAAQAYQAAIHADNIPATAFFVDDLQAEFERLHAHGVTFTLEPTDMGVVRMAVLDDTCGNLIQLNEMRHES